MARWSAGAAEPTVDESAAHGFLSRYCFECHGIKDEAANLDLRQIAASSDSWAANQGRLGEIIDAIDNGDMPPRKHPQQPTRGDRDAVLAHLRAIEDRLKEAHRDDPGAVVMPRLTKAEYNRVIQDLTGVDMQPARFFPNDSLAGEGFANVGEAQGTTMSEIERFLGAASVVAQHLQFSPETGIVWNAIPLEPTGSRRERIKQLTVQLADLVARQQNAVVTAHLDALRSTFGKPHIPYLEAGWEYRYRDALGHPQETLADVARRWQPALRPEILEKWWALLQSGDKASPQLQREIARWQALGPPPKISRDALRAEVTDICAQWEHLEKYYQFFLRPGYERVDKDQRKNFKAGRHPFDIEVGPKSLLGDHRSLHLLATDALAANPADVVIWRNPRFVMADGSERPLAQCAPVRLDAHNQPLGPAHPGEHPTGLPLPATDFAGRAPFLMRVDIPEGADRFVVEAVVDERIAGESSVQTVIRKEPIERPEYVRFYPGRQPWGSGDNKSIGRVFGDYYDARNLLIAQGLVLKAGRNLERALVQPRLKIDLRYVGGPWDKQQALRENAARPYSFTIDQILAMGDPKARTEFAQLFVLLTDIADPVRQDLEMLATKHGATLAPADRQLSEQILRTWPAADRQRAGELARALSVREAQRDNSARTALDDWLGRAWRRPPTAEERQSFFALYERERRRGQPAEAALRVPVMASLVAPDFLYRAQTARNQAEPYALRDEEIASRLSFFLWGTGPDAELSRLAAAQRLRDPAVLRAQVRRMMQDPRVDYLVVEFTGRWLQFAGFEEFSGPDIDRFKAFTPTLREAMYQEARAFFLHLFRENLPVTDVLLADYTFANEELARHYGIAGVTGSEMRRVSTQGTPRGGLLGMGAVLTRSSAPLRTSPVKRGHWIYENLMGYAMPEPPPNVPMISQDDVNEKGQSVRDQLAAHRADPTCASCHNKIDPLGIALENFDPVGAWRTEDSARQPVRARDTTADGQSLDGLPSLRAYLAAHRADFVRNFSEKLVGFALGRAVAVGDAELLDRIDAALAANDYRVATALELVVTSPQFLQRRDDPPPAADRQLTQNHP